MPIGDLLTMSATITTPGPSAGTNDMGDPVPGPDVVSVVACWLYETTTDEITGGRDVIRQTWQLYAPASAPVTALSRVTVDAYPGLEFFVDGQPWRAIPPHGNAAHVEAQLVLSGGPS